MSRLTLLVGLSVVACCAQPWSGIIAPVRAVDWSSAGVPGGIPSGAWSNCATAQCNTLWGGTVTKSSIEAAINSAPAISIVRIPAGTFTVSGGLIWRRSDVAVRGQGADQTILNFSSGVSCSGISTDVCILSTDTTYPGSPPSNVKNWTAGYAQGSNQITLNNTTGITVNQTLLVLDQCNDGLTGSSCSGSASDTGNIYNCDVDCASESSASGGYRTKRAQAQVVRASAINGNVITLSSPLYMPNWRSGQTPQVWTVTPIQNTGIENVTLNHTTAQPTYGTMLYSCYGCWVRGVRSIYPSAFQLAVWQSPHSTIRDNYFYHTGSGSQTSNSYSVELINTSDDLLENNIFHQCIAPFVEDGDGSGNVFGYNYAIKSPWGYTSAMNYGVWLHSAGVTMELFEGNVQNGFVGDDIHGSHHMITLFRNYYLGWESGPTQQTNAVAIGPFSRFYNVIGNVLGRAGYHTAYQGTDLSTHSIYVFNYSSPTDALSTSTLMRWGNYDTVNAAVRWESSEVPSGLALYANAVPAAHVLPASFYLAAKPSWWPSAKAWPPIGPDVAGGNIGNVSGHANTIPAQDCYLNVMGGTADGAGSVLSFNADTCYGRSGAASPAPPTDLAATVR